MIIDVRLDRLQTSGGETLEFPAAGVTCIVGGNNVGKSRLLREIDAALQSSETAPATFVELTMHKPIIDQEIAQRFLNEVGIKQRLREGYPQEYVPLFGGQNVNATNFVSFFHDVSGPSMSAVKPFFVWYASAGSLVGAASGGVGSTVMDGMGHPLVRLFRNGPLEETLSDLAYRSFGIQLTLARINADIRLRVGSVEVEVPPLNRPTVEYANAVAALPALDEQGDGLKSFLGLALNVLAGTSQILLIDEPEAFLHPSQARALGRWLGREAVRQDIQVVISTHDRDLVLGLLDSDESAVVNIVRLTRNGTVNHIHNLAHQQIAITWSDPVLRYSNVLQGLFHRKVVITESDADCRFYGAVVDRLAADEEKQAIADDLLFVPSGGKHRVATMASALTQLGVETFAIVDFDIMRSRSDVRNVVEALNGRWTDDMNAAYVTIASTANQAHMWDALKHQGLAGLPSGEVHNAGVRLLAFLQAAGMFVVPVGEMEDFDKSIGTHGAAWVSDMLSAGAHQTCTAARELLGGLLP